jgi:hypothetical protein
VWDAAQAGFARLLDGVGGLPGTGSAYFEQHRPRAAATLLANIARTWAACRAAASAAPGAAASLAAVRARLAGCFGGLPAVLRQTMQELRGRGAMYESHVDLCYGLAARVLLLCGDVVHERGATNTVFAQLMSEFFGPTAEMTGRAWCVHLSITPRAS